MPSILKAWLKEFRILFLLFVTLPVILGAVIAYAYDPGQFSLFYFFITAIAMMSLHAGTVIINDFFDYRSGTDNINKERTPYSGGSGLLPDKILKPGEVLAAGIACFILCIALGLFIVLTRSPILIVIGIVGVLLGLFYTTPPIKLAYRGLGEAARTIATPLIVLGAFLVQVPITSRVELTQAAVPLLVAFFSSLPVAFLNTAALYIFEFPDYDADAATGKRNLVVRLGKKDAVHVFYFLSALAYISILVFILLGYLPLLSGIALIAMPLSAFSAYGLMNYYDHPKKLVRYLKSASDAYVIATLLIALAFLL
ncbi:MAG TPA: prenyltransferase [Methanocellaceae archaeon]